MIAALARPWVGTPRALLLILLALLRLTALDRHAAVRFSKSGDASANWQVSAGRSPVDQQNGGGSPFESWRSQQPVRSAMGAKRDEAETRRMSLEQGIAEATARGEPITIATLLGMDVLALSEQQVDTSALSSNPQIDTDLIGETVNLPLPDGDTAVFVIPPDTSLELLEGTVSELALDVDRPTRGVVFPLKSRQGCSDEDDLDSEQEQPAFPTGLLVVPRDAATFSAERAGAQRVLLSHPLIFSTADTLVVVMEASAGYQTALTATAPLKMLSDASTDDLTAASPLAGRVHRAVMSPLQASRRQQLAQPRVQAPNDLQMQSAKLGGGGRDALSPVEEKGRALRGELIGARFDSAAGNYRLYRDPFSTLHALVMNVRLEIASILRSEKARIEKTVNKYTMLIKSPEKIDLLTMANNNRESDVASTKDRVNSFSVDRTRQTASSLYSLPKKENIQSNAQSRINRYKSWI